MAATLASLINSVWISRGEPFYIVMLTHPLNRGFFYLVS